MENDDQYPNWEDEIDIDESDLPSLLNLPILPSINSTNYPSALPPLKPCSRSQNPNLTPQPQTVINPSSRPRIPGPAAAVQLAMHRKSQNFILSSQGEKLHRRPDSVLLGEEDDDFKMNPWLCAAAFLGRDFELRTPISLIKNQKNVADRIPQVVGLVKSCVPNGLGDLFITLKDPTGTIGASVHRKVLMENSLDGDFSVGCVVILKEVVVFGPCHSSRYLNVTVSNMVKLISKDCGPPRKQMVSSYEAKQMIPSYETRYGAFASGKEMKDGREKLPSMRQREESIADKEAGREVNNGRITNLPYNITARYVPMSENSDLGKNISSSIAPKLDHGTVGTKNMTNKPDVSANTVANMVVKPDPRVNTIENMAAKSNLKTDGRAEATANMAVESEKSKRIISKVSVAQWTDEQLLELFADYQDDMLT